jgi:hypothetical protein
MSSENQTVDHTDTIMENDHDTIFVRFRVSNIVQVTVIHVCGHVFLSVLPKNGFETDHTMLTSPWVSVIFRRSLHTRSVTAVLKFGVGIRDSLPSPWIPPISAIIHFEMCSLSY